MNIDDKIWLIKYPTDASEHYSEINIKGLEQFGLEPNIYEGVTPEMLEEKEFQYLQFDSWWGVQEFTDWQKANFYTHVELWKKCFKEDTPMLIIEEDVCIRHPIHEVDDATRFQVMTEYNDVNHKKHFEIGEWQHPFWSTDFGQEVEEEDKGKGHVPFNKAYYISPKFAGYLVDVALNTPIRRDAGEYLFIGGLENGGSRFIKDTVVPIYRLDIGKTVEYEKIDFSGFRGETEQPV